MEYSSKEKKDFSNYEFIEYVENEDLKAGKYKVNVNGRLRCPLCLGKKKHEHLLQHASGVGKASSNKSAKQKVNHYAFTKYLKNDPDKFMIFLQPPQSVKQTQSTTGEAKFSNQNSKSTALFFLLPWIWLESKDFLRQVVSQPRLAPGLWPTIAMVLGNANENLRDYEARARPDREARLLLRGDRDLRRARRHEISAPPELSESDEGGIRHRRYRGRDSSIDEEFEQRILREPEFAAQPRNHYHQER
ncbi:hypothetical protein LWI28_028672 [Acer negundo]|uniref:Zinc finger-XS domain-containing protein n=1 Tax=Acer negundo TaxID=4023 RepID=A0AAD5IKW1_ACENE|nr:hypothetical protein LWI28_028672 [Acer negundo]